MQNYDLQYFRVYDQLNTGKDKNKDLEQKIASS